MPSAFEQMEKISKFFSGKKCVVFVDNWQRMHMQNLEEKVLLGL